MSQQKILQTSSSVIVVYRRKTLTGSPDPTRAAGRMKPCTQTRKKSLAHLVKHWPLKPIMIYCIRLNPTGSNFLVIVKSFDANTAISANFFLTVKKLDSQHFI